MWADDGAAAPPPVAHWLRGAPVVAASHSVPRAVLGLAAAASLLALCFSDALVAEVSGAPVQGVTVSR